MGFSMLGGIVSSILGGITSVIMAIVQPILEIVLGFVNRFIIAPLLSVVINLISYLISLVFYNISIFILALIDYVEMLFRLLAGLEVSGVTLNLSNSPDKGADLVLQLIRTPEVRDMFLSMVVVGMFLLIITTIFQMIKVEYTTEGAKNAKGPILNKAFKGLCNMILLPALCVFGVFLGNQVLDLLDKATKPDADLFGQSATVSGTLFVTAAGEAHYQKGDLRVTLVSPTIQTATLDLVLNIVPIIFNSISDAWGEAFNADDDKEYLFPDAVRKESESLVASGTISYFNIAAITQIYDYSKINYLLLIFGGCMVMKTFYYTCFGMIVRMYQCGMLFIVSPAVIGMTPINEGGLGKWRSEFMGQAISAYGVVLAVNIFFVLVRVMLSIDFSFEGVTGYFFGAGMMEGLLKFVIVIGGTISLEKFAKELGSYFGAKDALSQGKEMEQGVKKAVQDVGNGIVKAIGTAVQVAMMATGVGGAAVGGLKAAGGAMKAASMASKAAGGGMKGLAAGAKNLGSSIGNGMSSIGSKIADKAEGGVEFFANSMGIDYKTRDDKKIELMRDAALRENADAGAAVGKAQRQYSNATKSQDADLARERKLYDKAQSDFAAAQAAGDKRGMANAQRRMTSHGDNIQGLEIEKQQIADSVGLTAAQSRLSAAKSNLADVQKQADERTVEKSDQIMVRSGAGRQALKQHTIFGRAMSEADKKFDGYASAAAKEGGKETAAAYEHLQKMKSDRKEEAANERYAPQIEAKNDSQARIVKKMAIEEVQIANAQLDISKNSGLGRLNQMTARMNSSTDAAERAALSQQIEALRNSLADKLGVGYNDIQQVNGSYQVTANYHIDTANLERMFENIFKNGGMSNQQAIIDAVNNAIKGKSADEAKMIQEIFEKVVAKYNK
ncbi:MAG: hypothetical protein E7354_04995 [Clostridiales bacterium]|nr:hypothetical protein [Clostridiales bacterium]